jgi:thiamine kinase-like enzyme
VQRCHLDLGKRITGEARFFWVFQIIRDYAAQLKAANHRLAPPLPGWVEVADDLERAQVPVPVVFGHHDLLAGNFMDDGNRLWLIDWEYGAFSSPLFDLANLASNNSFGEAEEAQLLEAYFNESPGVALWRAFYAMKTASTLREAMWAMVSELHLTNTGIDYVSYAAEFLGRYERGLADYRARFGAI